MAWTPLYPGGLVCQLTETSSWQDYGDFSPATEGSSVSTWLDMGNVTNFTQTVGSTLCPIWHNNQINGLATNHFDPANTQFLHGPPLLTGDKSHTMFFVIKPTIAGGTGYQTLFNYGDTPGVNGGSFSIRNDFKSSWSIPNVWNSSWYSYDPAASTPGAATYTENDPQIVALVCDVPNGIARSWRNGAIDGSVPITGAIDAANAIDGTRLGLDAASGSLAYNGQIGEFLCYNRALSPVELNLAGYYLAQRWAIATAYPAPPPGPPGLLLWLNETGHLNTSYVIASNGDPINNWRDNTLNGWDFGQPGGYNPTEFANEINGMPAIGFPAGFPWLQGPNLLLGDKSHTIFIVLKPLLPGTGTYQPFYVHVKDTTGNIAGLLGLRAGDGKTVWSLPAVVSAGTGGNYAYDGTGAATYVNGEPAILTAVCDVPNSVGTTWKDGVLDGTLAITGPIDPENALAGTWLGLWFSGGLNIINGWAAEYRVFNRVLTSTELNYVGYRLGHKWAITTAYIAPPNKGNARSYPRGLLRGTRRGAI